MDSMEQRQEQSPDEITQEAEALLQIASKLLENHGAQESSIELCIEKLEELVIKIESTPGVRKANKKIKSAKRLANLLKLRLGRGGNNVSESEPQTPSSMKPPAVIDREPVNQQARQVVRKSKDKLTD